MNSNYSYDPSKPAFATLDDPLEEEFLNSGNPFANNGIKAYNPQQQELQTTVMKIQDVEQRTLDSTKRSLQAIAESEQIGVETAKTLVHQREQLVNTDRRLDMIQEDLKESQKNINAIKSVFSSFRQWMTKDKKKKDGDKDNQEKDTEDTKDPKDPSFDHNPALERAVAIAPDLPHPSLEASGATYGGSTRYAGPLKSAPSDDWRHTTSRVNQQLDQDLDDMAFGLSRLKGLAEGLGQEISGQNELIDSIAGKAEKTDLRLGTTNKQINTLLKK